MCGRENAVLPDHLRRMSSKAFRSAIVPSTPRNASLCRLVAALLLFVASAGAVFPCGAQGSPAPTSVEPIVVTSDKVRVETFSDRKVYRLDADLQSTFGTATDVLTGIPSVEVDADGIVALRGDTNVLILVDGKPMAQLSGPLAGVNLQQIPAQDIDRIEVITEPPAEYKAQGAAGVINIITRKSRKAGFSGTANASVGNDRRYVMGTALAYNAGPLSLSGGASLRQDDRERQILSDPLVPGPAPATSTQSENEQNEHVRRRIPVEKIGAGYQFDDGFSLDFSAERGGRTGERNFLQTGETSLEPGGLQSISDRASVGHEWSMDTDRRLVLDRKFAQEGEDLSLTLHRTTFHEREHYNYTNTYPFPPAAPTYDDLNLSEDLITDQLSLDYALPLARTGKLKIGYDFEGDDSTFGNAADDIDPTTGALTVNAAATNDFRYLQRVDALYGSYQDGAGPWTWTGGLRVERTHADERQLTDLDSTQRSYWQAFPNLRAEQVLTESSTLTFGASRRVTRPDASALNPYIDRQDTQNLRSGDPYLLPQDTQLFEVGYSVDRNSAAKAAALLQSYSVSMYLRRNHDSITDVSEAVGPDVVLTTKANLPRNDAAGVEWVSDGHFTRKLAYGLDANLFYTQIDASQLGASGLKSTVGLNAKAHIDFHPFASDTLQLALSRSDRRLTPQGEVAAINLVNAGYRCQIGPGLAFVATVSDLFNGQTYRRTVSTQPLTDTYERHVQGRIVYAGVVYSFGSKAKVAGFDYDQ
jgi:outer membrane receptor for ferrienterochelin and colicin